MNWTRPAALRAQLERWWTRGELLASVVRGEDLFPRRLSLRGPTAAEMAARFDEVRAWIAELRAVPRLRIEMRAFRHRVLGSNEIPEAVWVDSLDAALELTGKRREASRFAGVLAAARREQPALLAWLAAHPLQGLALADEWPRLLAIVAWLQAHPRSGLYLRQIDIPGVHSKFIEAHRGVLAELLELTLAADVVQPAAAGVSGFAMRYGLRDKPQRVRFRPLDAASCAWAQGADVTLDAASFARLDPPVSRVFITENEVNFLAFPPVEGGLVIFGAGYGFDGLGPARWLAERPVYYWGDIDTHGFAMLDQLRHLLPQARSLLMDRETLLAFSAHWGHEAHQSVRDLPLLQPDEQSLYDDLRDNRLRPNLRLEQERIGFGGLQQRLAVL